MFRTVQRQSRRFRGHVAAPRPKKKSLAALSKEALAVTQEVSQQTKKKYYDPSNVTLDFELLNAKLVNTILGDSRDRVAKRLDQPGKRWKQDHRLDMEQTIRQFRLYLMDGRISLKQNLQPLDIGDLVLLDSQSTLAHLVVQKPQDLKTSTYTLVNHEGEIVYVHRDQIKLRVPGVVPPSKVEELDMIQLEKKHPGLAPIGLPDSKFARSPEALPEGWLPKEEKLQKGSDQELLTTGDDFIMAQAASQLLTDTDVITYIVPTPVRRIISKPLVDTAILSFRKINSFTRVLDNVHKILQYDENNSLISLARSIPILELLNKVWNFERKYKLLEHADGQEEFRILNAQIDYLGINGPTVLGKPVVEVPSEEYKKEDFPISSYIGFMVALAQNPRKWKVNFQHNSKVPLNVDILPISKSIDTADALDFLKGIGIKQFTKFYTDFVARKSYKEPKKLKQVMSVLRDFVAGNIVEDRMLESVVGNLIRSIDHALDLRGLRKKKDVAYSYEYSKSRALEIITSLDQGLWCNPSRWSSSLNLPNTGISPKSDLGKQYYDFVDQKFTSKDALSEAVKGASATEALLDLSLENFDDEIIGAKSPVTDSWLVSDFHQMDPYASVREDFPNLPVYCIDSATAHEIDDGISIEYLDDSFKVVVHVADPTSVLKESSMLNLIAFEKGTTTYLPEGASLMMPQLISIVCGMDAPGKNRSFGVEMVVTRKDLEAFENSPTSEAAHKLMESIVESTKIKFFNIKDNAICITYEEVNKILADEANIERFLQGITDHSQESDLFNLSRVASALKSVREFLGALDFPNEASKTFVDYKPKDEVEQPHFQRTEKGFRIAMASDDSEQVPVIHIEKDVDQSQESKSQELVSNFMVTANHCASSFAIKNDVPIILRTQRLNLNSDFKADIKALMDKHRNGPGMTVQEMADFGKHMTAANYETNQHGHESLGLSSYSHFTSPLRRYTDMVNQWMLGQYLVKQCEWTKEQQKDLSGIANHLQICLMINKQAQRSSTRFWQASFLKQYFEQLKHGDVSEPIEFEFLLLGDAKRGDVRCKLKYFDQMKTTIVADDGVKRRFNSGEFEVGKVVTPTFKIKKLDMIEHEFTVELTST